MKWLLIRREEQSLWRDVVAGCVAGVAGSWAKSALEPPLQHIGERLFPPTSTEKALPGADITGNPDNMPPAILVNQVADQTVEHRLTHDQTYQAMTTIHYVFGTVVAVVYSIAAERSPFVRKGYGIPAGFVLWAGTHGSVVPLLGLQGKPTEMPTAWNVWELGSHLGFGLVVEIVRQVVRNALRA